MPDFSHLAGLDPKGDKLVPYIMDQIEGAPTIWFLPGTDANRPYLNETLKRANARVKGGRRTRRVTVDTIEASREEDRELLAKFCAKRWDVKDADGMAVEFTVENCIEFFKALPNWLFDEVRTFVTDPGNFIEADEMGEG